MPFRLSEEARPMHPWMNLQEQASEVIRSQRPAVGWRALVRYLGTRGLSVVTVCLPLSLLAVEGLAADGPSLSNAAPAAPATLTRPTTNDGAVPAVRSLKEVPPRRQVPPLKTLAGEQPPAKPGAATRPKVPSGTARLVTEPEAGVGIEIDVEADPRGPARRGAAPAINPVAPNSVAPNAVAPAAGKVGQPAAPGSLKTAPGLPVLKAPPPGTLPTDLDDEPEEDDDEMEGDLAAPAPGKALKPLPKLTAPGAGPAIVPALTPPAVAPGAAVAKPAAPTGPVGDPYSPPKLPVLNPGTAPALTPPATVTVTPQPVVTETPTPKAPPAPVESLPRLELDEPAPAAPAPVTTTPMPKDSNGVELIPPSPKTPEVKAPAVATPPAAAEPAVKEPAVKEPAPKPPAPNEPAPTPELPRLDVEAKDEPVKAPAAPVPAPVVETPAQTAPVPTPPAAPAVVTPEPTPPAAPAAPAAPVVPVVPVVPVAPEVAAPVVAPVVAPTKGPKVISGLKVPEGFEVTEYAGDGLAHDIYSMTLDSHGRVVVSGPGYIKILIDTDGDGQADKARRFADGPASGAQGMCFVGNDLICTADEGLIRYKDANGDGKADGPPETFLKLPTGGEHNAHAVRRGPDGWWYVICGNTSEIDHRYITLPTSPIKTPHAGVIIRLKPDMSGGEAFCDGLRNAYDFDFGPSGDVFVYDSDGERDMALPWYLPTRLFHVLPGGNQGWMTDAWKLPDNLPDASPVVCETGRGSPTGVTFYRHSQFPEKYRGGMFLLDWTFGRIWFVNPERTGDTYAGKPEEFLATRGDFGLAPTDAEVGPDGSLFVCVGGRGTHGTVYRVRHVAGSESESVKTAAAPIPETATTDQALAACLQTAQPNASWGRNRWVPVAAKLGSTPFLNAAMAEERPVGERLRAIEILTELSNGLPGTALEILATARSPEVRAHAMWSFGMRPDPELNASVLVPYLQDADPLVRRRAVEALARSPKLASGVKAPLAKCLGDDSRLVRLATIRLFPTLDSVSMKEVAETARKQSWQAAVTAATAYVWRQQFRKVDVQTYGLDVGRKVLEAKVPPTVKLQAVRLMQLSLGDLGSLDQMPAVYDGYISPLPMTLEEQKLDPVRATVAKVYPTGDHATDFELGRLIAMIAPSNPELLDKVLTKITEESHPTDDVHHLIVASRIIGERDEGQRTKIAAALVRLDAKVLKLGLQLDSGWTDHLTELYGKFVEADTDLPGAIITQAGFGRPNHVLFLGKIGPDQVAPAVAAFVTASEAADYAWNNDVVFVFGFAKKDEYYDKLRAKWDRHDLRMAILLTIAEVAVEKDRSMLAEGLDFLPQEVLTACVGALERLEVKPDAKELAQLVKLLRRPATEPWEHALRDRAAALFTRNSGEEIGWKSAQEPPAPQPEAVAKAAAWLSARHPAEAAEALGSPEADLKSLVSMLSTVEWEKGDAARGKKLYVERGCAQCHAGGRGLGPDLAGITGRFSREEVFIATALPNRDVSPRYQTLMIETKSGQVHTGLSVYEDTDGVMIRNGTNQTRRIEAADIESKRPIATSLMPTGLLKDLKPADLADLYAFLRTLGVKLAAKP
jgi:putative membrane-bound dehydrogenase-like protein